MKYKVSLSTTTRDQLDSLFEKDEIQEDICFAVYYPSTGTQSFSALIHEVIFPGLGDRLLHGNVSFTDSFFVRALARASELGGGLAMIHSHPLGMGWQDMSDDDIIAEDRISKAVYGRTSLPLLGMTWARDHFLSGRFWIRSGYRQYDRTDCHVVKVVGPDFHCYFNRATYLAPEITGEQVCTLSAWGPTMQADLTQLHVGIVGAGSVGGIVAEALARIGIQEMSIFDFDRIEERNLDRLIYADRSMTGSLKVIKLKEHIDRVATADGAVCNAMDSSIAAIEAIDAALNCDVLFSCVDRPLGRHIVNQIGFVHMIPVIDGGILARANKSGNLASADWRSHVAVQDRACLRCLGQYELGQVQAEREGHLDDPKYIAGLPEGHPLKARQNVIAFALACASRIILQYVSMVVRPLGRNAFGSEHYHFAQDSWEPKHHDECKEDCFIPAIAGLGNSIEIV